EVERSDQVRSNRAAQQTASDETKGGRSHCHCHRTLKTKVGLKCCSERCTGTVPARHRDGTSKQSKQRIDAHEIGKRNTNSVLSEGERTSEDPEPDNLPAASFQQREACAKPDCREKRNHQW